MRRALARRQRPTKRRRRWERRARRAAVAVLCALALLLVGDFAAVLVDVYVGGHWETAR